MQFCAAARRRYYGTSNSSFSWKLPCTQQQPTSKILFSLSSENHSSTLGGDKAKPMPRWNLNRGKRRDSISGSQQVEKVLERYRDATLLGVMPTLKGGRGDYRTIRLGHGAAAATLRLTPITSGDLHVPCIYC